MTFIVTAVIVLKSILSDISIATAALFWFLFAWKMFFHPFTFSLYISLHLKRVSRRQHIDRCCVLIHSATQCLLIGEFSAFTFKVTIDRYALIPILLIVFWLFCIGLAKRFTWFFP